MIKFDELGLPTVGRKAMYSTRDFVPRWAGQIKSVELVGLTGRNNAIKDPQVFLSWSKDGMTWSNERLHRQGLRGQFGKRIMWFRAIGLFHQMVALRFRGCDDSLASFSAIEIDVEAFGNIGTSLGGGGGQ